MDGMNPIQDGKESGAKGNPTVKSNILAQCQENGEDI
jgi:hypothetical protein